MAFLAPLIGGGGAGAAAAGGAASSPGITQAATAGLAVGPGILQGVAETLAGAKLRRANKKRIEELEAALREPAGAFGIDPRQKRQLRQELFAPVQEAATTGRQEAGRLAAAGGLGTGADASRLRTEQQRITGEGGQRAAAAVQAADLQLQLAQEEQAKQELAQRQFGQAQESLRQVRSIFGPIAQAAAPLGAGLASPPGTGDLAGPTGGPIRNEAAISDALRQIGWTDEQIQTAIAREREQPGYLASLAGQAQQVSISPSSAVVGGAAGGAPVSEGGFLVGGA